mgnify:CR=1 FL=1
MTTNIIPPFLKKGDTIGILSTARSIELSDIKHTILTFESWGLKTVIGKTIGLKENQFAGTDNQRCNDFNSFIEDENIDAIFCARGGYGSARIADSIHIELLKAKPKWVCGYSDITVLHGSLNANGLCSLHSTMPINFETNTSESIENLKQALFGSLTSYVLPTNSMNITGSANGQIIGGNLSVLFSIMNSPSSFNLNNSILFIEDLDEYLYHVDRMMINLRRSGFLSKMKGIIVGGMTEMNDNDIPFGKSALDIIHEHTRDLGIPVCFDFPAGHIENNNPIFLGVQTKFDVSNEKTTLKFSL